MPARRKAQRKGGPRPGAGRPKAAAALAEAAEAAAIPEATPMEELPGLRRSERTNRINYKELHSSGRPSPAAASVRKECADLPTLSQAMSSQSSAGGRRRVDLAWRNRRILRNLRNKVPLPTVARLFGLSADRVYRIKRNFLETGALAGAPRTGRPISYKMLRARVNIKRKVDRDPRRTAAGLAREAGISKTSAVLVLRSLGLASRARRRKQKLTPADKAKRAERAQKLINLLSNKPRHSLVFASDEAWIDTDPFRNSRVDRIIVKKGQDPVDVRDDLGINQRQQRAPGVMIWGCTSSNGKSQVIVLPPKTRVNAVNYQELILKPHVAWLKANFTAQELKGSLWLQDSAPGHTARSTQAWLKKNLGKGRFGLKVKWVGPGIWPPKSPDLNPLDYAIWAPLKRRVQGQAGVPGARLHLLKARILRSWPEVANPTFVKKIHKSFRGRLMRVIAANGGYFEKKW